MNSMEAAHGIVSMPPESASSPFARPFLFGSGVVLAVTGLAKLWSGLGDSAFLKLVDPIIGLNFGHLMLAVGVVEIVVALLCLLGRWQLLALSLIAWLSSSFLIYRVGLWWMGWKKPCSCLGNLTDALGIAPATADSIMKIVLACLLLGSYWLLFQQWRAVEQRKAGVSQELSPS